MATPKVSVVVPNYNYARYLPERIQSILNQTFQDFELILLDDASTDNSVDLLEHWRNHPKVSHIVVNERNSGSPFRQWQKGIELARGELIWIAEADDSAHPGFLAATVAALASHPRAAVCFTGCDNIDADGNPLNNYFDDWGPRREARELDFFDGPAYTRHNMYWANYVYNASGALFRREAFLKSDVARACTMRNSGDWLVWASMIAPTGIVMLYKHLNCMRMHGKSQTDLGRSSGNLLREDINVVVAVEAMAPIGWYRRHMRHGQLYKDVCCLPESSTERTELLASIRRLWPDVRFSYQFLRLVRLFGIRPKKRDRL